MRYIKGLRIDWDGGEGEVKLPDEFEVMSGLFKVDVIGDWIYDLKQYYEQALEQHKSEMEAYYEEENGTLEGFEEKYFIANKVLGIRDF